MYVPKHCGHLTWQWLHRDYGRLAASKDSRAELFLNGYPYIWRHDLMQGATFRSQCCPQVLTKRWWFYSKHLLGEAARLLTISLPSSLTESHDHPGCACVSDL